MDPRERSELIDRVGVTSTPYDVYTTLTRERLHLRYLVMQDVHTAVLDYLESYSGLLERLEVYSIGFREAKELDALAERFYKTVLPKAGNFYPGVKHISRL